MLETTRWDLEGGGMEATDNSKIGDPEWGQGTESGIAGLDRLSWQSTLESTRDINEPKEGNKGYEKEAYKESDTLEVTDDDLSYTKSNTKGTYS